MSTIERPARKFAFSTRHPACAVAADGAWVEIERWTSYGDAERSHVLAQLPCRLDAMNARMDYSETNTAP